MSVTLFTVLIACLKAFIFHKVAASNYELISATIYWKALDIGTISYTIESAWRASQFNVTAKDVDTRVIDKLVKFQIDTRSKDTIMVAGRVIGVLGLSDIFMAMSTISVTYSQPGLVTAAVIDLGTQAASISTGVVIGDAHATSLRAALPPKITVCDSVPSELHIAAILPPRSRSSYTVYSSQRQVAGPSSIMTTTGSVIVLLQEATPTLVTIRLTSNDLVTGTESHVDLIIQVWIDPTCHISSKDSVPLYNALPARFISWVSAPTSFSVNPSYSSALTTFETFPYVPAFTLSDTLFTNRARETSESFICVVATDNLVGTNEWGCMIAVAMDPTKASIRADVVDTVINNPTDLHFLGTGSGSLYQIIIADANHNVIMQTDAFHDPYSQPNAYVSHLTAPAVAGAYTVVIRNARTFEIFGLGRWNVINPSPPTTATTAPGTPYPQNTLVQILQEPSSPVTVTNALSGPISIMDKSFQVIVNARDSNGNVIADSGGVVIVTLADVLFFGTLNLGMASVTVTPSNLGAQPLIVTLPYSNSPILKSNVDVLPLPSEPYIGTSTIIVAPDSIRIGESSIIEWIAYTTSGSSFTNATSFRFTTSMDSANTNTLVIDSGVQVCNQSSPNTFCISWIALKAGPIIIEIRNDPRNRVFYTKNVTATPGDVVLAQTTVTGSGTSDHAYVGDTLELFMTARDRYGNIVPPANSSTQVFQVGVIQGTLQLQATNPSWNYETSSWKSEFLASVAGTLAITISLNGVPIYIRSINVIARQSTVSVQWIWLPISFSMAGLAAAGYANYRRRKRPDTEDSGSQTLKGKKSFANDFAFVNQTGILTTASSNSTQLTGNLDTSDFTMSANLATSDNNQATLSSEETLNLDAAGPSMADMPIRDQNGCSSGEAMIEMNSFSDESVKLVPIRNGIEWRPTKERSRFLIRSKKNTFDQSAQSDQKETDRPVAVARSVW